MSSAFWNSIWQKGDIRFHRDSVHPTLVENASLFLRGSTVLVPLCGKSVDMVWLADQGHKVVGAELSAIACRDFFRENQIEVQVRKEGDFEIYESERIEIWCGDFFALPNAATEKVNAFYDRAALIALPKEMRRRYADTFQQLASQKLSGILITMMYDDPEISGPPFSVDEKEVRELYKPFRIRTLTPSDETLPKDHPKFLGKPSPKELAFHLSA